MPSVKKRDELSTLCLPYKFFLAKTVHTSDKSDVCLSWMIFTFLQSHQKGQTTLFRALGVRSLLDVTLPFPTVYRPSYHPRPDSLVLTIELAQRTHGEWHTREATITAPKVASGRGRLFDLEKLFKTKYSQLIVPQTKRVKKKSWSHRVLVMCHKCH